MKRWSPRGLNGGLLGEWLLILPVLASVGWVINTVVWRHYLPQPFVFAASDTFMDWFNTAQYAHIPGAYDVWHSVYPPLSFVFLRIFTLHRCYIDPFYARDCDWLGRAAILVTYVADCLVAFALFRRVSRATAVPRAVAFALGLPLLFCLERGNLILACLPAFMIAHSGVARSRFWRGLAIAVTINFKPYLVISSLALGIKRDWRSLEIAGLLTIALYCATLAWFGSGDPFQLAENTRLFANLVAGQFYQQSYYSTSYSTLLSVNSDDMIKVLDYLPSRTVETLMVVLPALIHVTQAIALAGAIAAWLQPAAVPLPRVNALLTGAYLVTQSPGGYAFTFFVFLIFLETGRRGGQAVALLCTYLQAITYDVILSTVFNSDQVSWLTGVTTQTVFGLAVGQLVRPGLLIVTLWALAYDTITQAILAHRERRPSLGLMPA